VDLVDEEDIAGLQVREDGNEVTLPLDRRARCDPEADPHFDGDDRRQGGLAKPRGAVEENVVERLTSSFRRLDENAQALFHALLADVFGEAARPQAPLQPYFVRPRCGTHHSLAVSAGKPAMLSHAPSIPFRSKQMFAM
jgi:hypothetical protein